LQGSRSWHCAVPETRQPETCTTESSTGSRGHRAVEEYNQPLPSETVKQRAIEALQTLLEDATIDDAIERLCLIAKVEEALRQSDAGRVTDHEEVKKRFLA
jgi:hypothetical protein